jgi:asparagine synthase (glutamine-hydrolysing)
MAVAAANVLERQALGSWLASLSDAQNVANSTGERTLSLFAAPGQTPVSSAERASCRLVFDGWLYNRQELRRQFAASLRPGADDAELALQAYMRWGEEALHKLKGIFALCLWDGRSGSLLCARDPLGIYPLFYAETRRELLFSTSLDVLAQHPRVPATLNRAALAEYLHNRSPEIHETFYAGIYRLPPGHVLRVRGDSRQVYRYWNPAPQGSRIDWIRDDEVERFEAVLAQAVDRCLELGQAGIFLSGGLDSTTVATVAAQQSRLKGVAGPRALSYSVADPEWVEERVQRGVAEGLGLAQSYVSFDEAIGPKGMLLASLELCQSRPAPILNAFLPVFLHLAERGKACGCQVILTGDGGDEWFAYLPWTAADLLSARDVARLYRLWNVQRASSQAAGLALLWRDGLRPLLGRAKTAALYRLAPGVMRARQGAPELPTWLMPDPALRQAFLQRHERSLEDMRQEEGTFYQRAIRYSLDHVTSSMSKELVFEEGRRMGFRLLSPFWDADLVEFLIRTPYHLRNPDGQTKGLLRRRLHHSFPQLGFNQQQKRNPVTFYTSRMVSEGRKAWQQLGGPKGLAELGIVDAAAAERESAAIFAKDEHSSSEAHWLWMMLSTEAWVQSRLANQERVNQSTERR